MNIPILIAVSLMLSMNPLSAGQRQKPDISVLMTKMELAGDYAADSKVTHNVARATSVNTSDVESSSAFDRMEETAETRVGKKYRVSILVRNDGPKTVHAVTLEYALGYWHGRTRPELLSFTSTHHIDSGGTRTIFHSFISSKHVLLRPGRQASVKKIVYSDGSVWRRN
jgi:hypothetical protein